MTDSKVQELARFGAEARLRSIEEERTAILGIFPELRSGSISGGRLRNPVAESLPRASTPRRKRMSRVMRKAVGENAELLGNQTGPEGGRRQCRAGP
jgi:hypothetical protein